jgi:uncharacterized protein YjcR
MSKVAGRPPKYRAEFCQIAEDFLATGKSLTQLATHLNVRVQTIHEWTKSKPPFSDSIKKGVEASQAWWEDVATRVAMNIPLKVNNAEHRVHNPAMMIFLMKNRFRATYGDQITVSAGEFDFEDEQSLV